MTTNLTVFDFIVRAALIKLMHQYGVSKVEVSRSEIEGLINEEISLSIVDKQDLYDTRIVTCPELERTQRKQKKQLPWDENNENNEVEVTIEES